MVDQRIIDKVKRYLDLLPTNLGLKKAYIFGSFVNGNEREGSDIDVALVFENMQEFFTTQRQLRYLRRDIDLRIEPHPIREQDFNSLNPFASEIKRTGFEIDLTEVYGKVSST